MYYCGWDGGGTKTALCAISPDGRVIHEAEFGPLNLNGTDRESVRTTVLDAVDCMRSALPGGLSGCACLVIGMAGISNQTSVCFIENSLREAGYTGPLSITGDQAIALNGAIRGYGAVLVAGTGSVCCGRDSKGTIYRTGGYGYLIDDPGSGYAIGRDILTAVVQAHDGRIAPTVLKERVFRTLEITRIEQLISWLYATATSKHDIAALSKLLPPALEQHDAAASLIAEKAANDLSLLVQALWRKAGFTAGELALTGGILNHFLCIRTRLVELIHAIYPEIEIHDPLHTPAYGAAMMALASASPSQVK